MGQVRQNEQSGGRRLHPGGLLRRTRAARLVAAGLTAAALLSGCALGTESGSGGPGTTGQAGPAPETKAQRLAKKQAAIAAATRRWGLAQVPLTAPAPPDAKPTLSTRDGFEVEGQENLPHVFTTVPVKERVVFLTIDDGAEKDPEFLRMMKELDIPYSAFLSDYLVSEDYDYFRAMQKQGTALHNHTLDHPYLPGLSYEEQRHQICGMQDIIEKQHGKRPRLFRPRTATTTRTPSRPPSPAASRPSPSGTRRRSSTASTTANGIGICIPGTSCSPISGGRGSGTGPWWTWFARR